MYWRVNDIPELHNVPVAQRRRLWAEAATRSFRVRYLLVRLVAGLFGGAAFAGLAYLSWSDPLVWLASGLVGVAFVGVVFVLCVAQPRARRWLRKHGRELDRYLSA